MLHAGGAGPDHGGDEGRSPCIYWSNLGKGGWGNHRGFANSAEPSFLSALALGALLHETLSEPQNWLSATWGAQGPAGGVVSCSMGGAGSPTGALEMLGAGQPVVCEVEGLRRRKVAQLPGTSLVFHGLTFSCAGEFAVRVENAAARRGKRAGGEASRAGREGFPLPGCLGHHVPARAESVLCRMVVRGCGHSLHQTHGFGECSLPGWIRDVDLVGGRAASQAE